MSRPRARRLVVDVAVGRRDAEEPRYRVVPAGGHAERALDVLMRSDGAVTNGSFAVAAASSGVSVRSVADWPVPTVMNSPSTRPPMLAPSLRNAVANLLLGGARAHRRNCNERRDTDDDAERRQNRAEPIRPKRSKRNPPLLGASSSDRSADRGSSASRARPQRGGRRPCAVCATHVQPPRWSVSRGRWSLLLRFSRSNTPSTSSALAESRFPVGSSGEDDARFGGTRARAIGVRCCCPPESCRREMGCAVAEADLPKRIDARRCGASQRHARVNERELDVPRGGRARQQVEGLEHEADLTLRTCARRVSSSRGSRSPAQGVGSSRPSAGRDSRGSPSGSISRTQRGRPGRRTRPRGRRS